MKIFPALRRWPILALPLLVWGVLGSPERLAGQLLPASTSALGMAGNYSALARGFAAPGANREGEGVGDESFDHDAPLIASSTSVFASATSSS